MNCIITSYLTKVKKSRVWFGKKTRNNYLSVGYIAFVKYCPSVLYIWAVSSSGKSVSTKCF